MRQFFIRFQLVFVSIVLLATFVMMMGLSRRYNRRWDVTQERIYSLSKTTSDLLSQMSSGAVEIFAFYPHDDPSRSDFEIFLKECQMHHDRFQYHFYDPDRSPQLAKKWKVNKVYTVIVRYNNREERALRPNEEMLANVFLRLLNPKEIPLCFVTGHGEAGLWNAEKNGIQLLRETLEENHYSIHEILLARDKIPVYCQLIVVAGPQSDWNGPEFDLLKLAFQEERSILFLMDPVDPGMGKGFEGFIKDFGLRLGSDVIVDKMSRMVGGDFLVPFVNQYANEHPITAHFDMATFFPVTRSVQPEGKPREDLTIIPIAFSGSGSWAETNLATLEKGEAAFEAESDFPGPIAIAVAIEKKGPPAPLSSAAKEDKGKDEKEKTEKPAGSSRMVVVGDSDFVSNNYIDLAGNKDLTLKIIQWLAKDERRVVLHKPAPEFQPLFLNAKQRFVLLAVTLVGYPLVFLICGGFLIFLRRRVAA